MSATTSSSPVARLILVRHGETIANREFRYLGMRDDKLSEHGRNQAEHLAAALAFLPLAAIYSSPLSRAAATAAAIAARHGLDIRLTSGLREGSFGAWEGLSRAEVLAQEPDIVQRHREWERDPASAPPDGESFASIQERVVATVEQLAQTHAGQTIVLVSHVGPIKVLLCRALGAPLSSLFHIFLDPATISVIDWRPARPLVRLLNSHAHLGWEQARWMRDE
jgi:broad specificity phosphatase PhoE